MTQFIPLVKSYLEKQKSYTEENFKNDYPYEIFDNKERISINDYTLQDVFAVLRKKAFDKASMQSSDFRYVYSIITGKWKKFDKNITLAQGEYALTSVDDDNTCQIYDSKLSFLQDLNVSKNTKSFIVSGNLIFYNADKLQLSKVTYNGRSFALQLMNTSDVSSLFPGINIIYIDSYQDYTIDVSKVNEKETYIILSRYMNGFENYKISVVQGRAATSSLSNMFAVPSNDDAVLLFKDSSVSDQETSENAPTYKIHVRTLGYTNSDRYTNDSDKAYDDKTKYDTEDYSHSPNMMPKIIKEDLNVNKNNAQETKVKIDVENVPSQQIEPPSEDD